MGLDTIVNIKRGDDLIELGWFRKFYEFADWVVENGISLDEEGYEYELSFDDWKSLIKILQPVAAILLSKTEADLYAFEENGVDIFSQREKNIFNYSSFDILHSHSFGITKKVLDLFYLAKVILMMSESLGGYESITVYNSF